MVPFWEIWAMSHPSGFRVDEFGRHRAVSLPRRRTRCSLPGSARPQHHAEAAVAEPGLCGEARTHGHALGQAEHGGPPETFGEVGGAWPDVLSSFFCGTPPPPKKKIREKQKIDAYIYIYIYMAGFPLKPPQRAKDTQVWT